jgi:SAM-dependent methyltransferase
VPQRLRQRLFLAYLRVRYRGDGVECPCCGRHYRAFAPLGGRSGVICPGCGLHERHRALWLFLRARTNLFSDELRVLHLAPEALFQRRLRAQANLDYLSADLDSPVAMSHFDVTRIPHPDDSFDAILCIHVLEHVADDRAAMSELRRVLRAGGWALVLVPVDASRSETYEDPAIRTPEERAQAYWQHDHVRLYGRDFPDRLREAGFMVTVDPYIRELDAETARRHGLAGHEMYVCTKGKGR